MIVPDDQLAQAIGRDGQNVRLAARLTGWHIEIKSESDYAHDASEGTGEASEDEAQVRCAAVLSNGRRCPNAPLEGSRYCGLDAHQALAGQEPAEPAVDVVTESSASESDED